jgi:hypothetical protein
MRKYWTFKLSISAVRGQQAGNGTKNLLHQIIIRQTHVKFSIFLGTSEIRHRRHQLNIFLTPSVGEIINLIEEQIAIGRQPLAPARRSTRAWPQNENWFADQPLLPENIAVSRLGLEPT